MMHRLTPFMLPLFLFSVASHSVADTLKIVDESKIHKLIKTADKKTRLEASGVTVKDKKYYVVFDNLTQIAVIEKMAKNNKANHFMSLTSPDTAVEGFEGISFDANNQLYTLIETQVADDLFEGGVYQYSKKFKFKSHNNLAFKIVDDNKGFEGITLTKKNLLVICEGNYCEKGQKSLETGQGRIAVYEKKADNWVYKKTIHLPKTVDFADYAGLAIHKGKIAIVSQESSALWIANIDEKNWTFGAGKRYEFPKNKKGETVYCNIEGIAWVSATELVAVSDKRKSSSQPKVCKKKDQSIHLISIK